MRYLGFILIVLIAFACDTEQNTPNPQETHFLRYYGGPGYQKAIDMVANADGSFVLLGQSKLAVDAPSNIYLVKVDKNGYVLWETNFGVDELAKDLEPSPNGYLVLSDSLYDVGPNAISDIMVRSVDEQGQVLQSSTFSFLGDYNEVGATVTQLYDAGIPAGFIATGYTDAPSDGSNALIGKTAIFIRFDQGGNLYSGDWHNNAGAEGEDYGVRVAQLTDSTFYFFGYFNSRSQIDISNTSYNYWVSEMNEIGIVETDIVPGSPASDEKLTSVLPLNKSNSAFILSGSTSDGLSDKIFVSGIGASIDSKALDIDLGNLQTLNESYRGVSMIPLYRGGYLVAANQVEVDDSDIILIKLDADGKNVWSAASRFGGAGNDQQAAITELADGRIVLLGTMEIGADRQSKMVLMKLNKKGQLTE